MTWEQGKARTGTARWKATARRILKRDDYRCTWMDNGQRCTERATDVDHIVPDFEGGTDDDANLRSLCPPHHRRKTAAEGVAARARNPRRRPAEQHPGLKR